MDPIASLVRKLERRDRISVQERDVLAGLVERIVTHAPGDVIVREGEPQTTSRLLLAGVAARSKELANGGRQITELHIEGDFIDLHSFLLKALDHDVVAVSPAQVAIVPHERLRVVTEREPHLTRMLWLSTLLDAAIHREWLVSAGRRSARQQLACLFCEMMLRYEVVGQAQGGRYSFPLTQKDLADACGLTPVHVNRILQELRAEGLINWRGGEIAVLDFDRLSAVGGFEPEYLGLNHQPR
jgi:CRP-like cAMP-binding protein